MPKDCVFCKIKAGEVPSVKVWESDDFLAFLDIMPNVKGMTVVVPKKHTTSKLWKVSKQDYSNLMIAVWKTAKILKKGLKAERVFMVMEGLDVDHAHIKLYPVKKPVKNMRQVLNQPRKKKNQKELKKVLEEIRSVIVK